MRRAAVSMRVQMSSARGTSSSPEEVSTARSGVPGWDSPGKKTSRTLPRKAGACGCEQGEEESRGGARSEFEDGTADQVGYKIFSCGKQDALFKWNPDFKAAKLFGVVDGRDPFEMENAETGMIAVGPERFQLHGTRSGLFIGKENFGKFFEAVGEIGEQFGGDFAFVSAGADDACDGNELRFGGIGHGQGALEVLSGENRNRARTMPCSG